jgi:hypothetical protein
MEQAEAQIKLLDSLMHNGTFSDDTFLMIEKTLADIKNIYKGAGENHPLEIIDPMPAKTSREELVKSFYSSFKN